MSVQDDDNPGLALLSEIVGWIYFSAWSISFYGQLYENFRRKQVKGVSFDFVVYNFTGFSAYTLYTIWGRIDPKLGTGPVSIPDIFFAGHALIITILTMFQILFYYDKEDPHQVVSTTCRAIIVCLWWGFFQIIILERILGLYDPRDDDVPFRYNSLIYLGFCKVFISLIKYIPQVLKNYRRKSTAGWSIFNILLDMTGGAFSFAQNIIDTIRGKSVIGGGDQNNSLNIAKYALSFISIFFDTIFIIQHYCLYPENKNDNHTIGYSNDFNYDSGTDQVDRVINPTLHDSKNNSRTKL